MHFFKMFVLSKWVLAGILFLPVFVLAKEQPQEPVIAIIIDDMGNHLGRGEAMLGLPGPVTLAFLPHTPNVQQLAKRAHQQGKEVMLHLPLQSESDNHLLGPGGLTLFMTEVSFIHTLHRNLDSIPHVSGLTNHSIAPG